MDKLKMMRGGPMPQYIKSVLISVAVGELVTILLLLLFSIAICKMDFPMFVSDGFVILAAVLGAFTAGMLCGRMNREKGLLLGLICGGVLLLIMFLFNASFHQLTSPLFLLLKVLLILLGSVFGGIIGVNRKSRRIKY